MTTRNLPGRKGRSSMANTRITHLTLSLTERFRTRLCVEFLFHITFCALCYLFLCVCIGCEHDIFSDFLNYFLPTFLVDNYAIRKCTFLLCTLWLLELHCYSTANSKDSDVVQALSRHFPEAKTQIRSCNFFEDKVVL
jgi:hypothetical protein